jgi:predicted ATPase
MRFTRIHLKNWRNFLNAEVPLQRRAFLVGPNASGKSNFLDAFRFLRDIANPKGGGFQNAINNRNGVSKIRTLHARKKPAVIIEAEVDLGDEDHWTYFLEFSQDSQRIPVVKRELVWHSKENILTRPDDDDKKDETRLTQTHLEQVNANNKFRALQESFAKIRYLHIVPQLVRDPDRSVGRKMDPYGGDFIEQIARTHQKTRESRLRSIEKVLKIALPQLEKLELHFDDNLGVPHLRGLYAHWRDKGSWQFEDQFSDGTLRLIGLLWALFDGDQPILLEEPELSLHAAVIRYIPAMMNRINQSTGRQILVSTHSAELLSDEGIPPEEVIMLTPTDEATEVSLASDDREIKALLQGGLPLSEAVVPRTAPRNVEQLALFPDQ